MKKVVAIILAAAMIFGGCSYDTSFEDFFLSSGIADPVAYEDMEYYRPDMAYLEQVLQESCEAALYGESLEDVEDGIWEFYWVYDDFYTNYNLAYIHYCGDLTDIYWEEEYYYCADNSAVADAALEELYYTLADSPFREELEGDDYFGAGYFDAYEGESVYDETFLSLLEQETALINEYYNISSDALAVEPYTEEYFSTYGTQLGALFVKLVAVRQDIASYVGYESYPEFAYDFYYYRDYTPRDALLYTQQVREELVDIYRQVNGSSVWELGNKECSEEDTYAYVRHCAAEMGGIVEEAFALMEEGGYYDISYGENKSGGSFEVFLSTYYVPFVFTSPYLTVYDKLVFAHEFGHFINDYASGGSYSGIDVAEVFSQGFEYLSLCYGEDTADLEKYKMADSLCTFVEEAAYASFEHQVYDLKDEELTVENVYGLYEEICLGYGFDSWNWDSRDFVLIEHFFTEPMYVISYVVSNDVAFQIYQQEKQRSGAGLEIYQDHVECYESYIVSFAENIGLESPFAPGRLETVRRSMEDIFG